MKEGSLSKIKYLLIWHILCTEADEEHPMSTKDLLAKLKKDYGIDCDRRTLYRNIEEINEYEEFEIGTHRARSNMYFAKKGGFSNGQLRILFDTVQAMCSISETQTKALEYKFVALSGHGAEEQRKSSTRFRVSKSTNDEIFDSVDVIAEAIGRKKKITFRYFWWAPPKHKGEQNRKMYKGWRVLNPVDTVFSEEKYYLIGYYDDPGSFRNFRIDHMENVKMMEDDITDQEDTPYKKRQDVVEYQKTLFSMYAGDLMQVTFLIEKELWEEAYIKFRDNIESVTSTSDKVRVVATVQNSPTFIVWCCSLGTKLKVVSPPELVKAIKKNAQEIADQYK